MYIVQGKGLPRSKTTFLSGWHLVSRREPLSMGSGRFPTGEIVEFAVCAVQKPLGSVLFGLVQDCIVLCGAGVVRYYPQVVECFFAGFVRLEDCLEVELLSGVLETSLDGEEQGAEDEKVAEEFHLELVRIAYALEVDVRVM